MKKGIKFKTSFLAFSCITLFTQSACGNPYPIGTPTQADSYFNQAERDASRGNIGKMYDYQEKMEGSSLEMYPEYWRLNQNLSTQTPQAIIDFVKRYEGSAIAEKLVADYAEAKARTNDYATVRQIAHLITNADASEACAIALGFNNTGDAMRAFIEKPNVWLNTFGKQPELCLKLASDMNKNPLISTDDREQRLYRMLRVDRSQDIIQLSGQLGVYLDQAQLSMISANPNNFLASFNALQPTASNRYLYLYALARLAKKSVGEAGMQFNYDLNQDNLRSEPFFDEKTRRYAYRTLGVARMNVNTDQGFSIEAVDWLQKSVGEPFNFEEAEDYAQAGIRFGRWQDVITAIGAMDHNTQSERIWQYWLAKAYQNSGDNSQKKQARQIFVKLAEKNDYYGLLAKDQIGQRLTQLPSNPPISNDDYQRLNQDENFRRAFVLYGLSANPAYTNREWNWAVKKARDKGDKGLIVAAAQQAHDIGWYDRSIYAFESSPEIANSATAYPMPFKNSVVQYSRQAGISPAWAYGITRQESRFNVGAKSHVGAGGLMQIMPDTAKYVARKLGEPYDAKLVTTGDTNIRYGTFYMSDVLNKFGGQMTMTTAGYNAGPNRAIAWQPTYGTLPADQYVESIPFPETRHYVKAVMENTVNYGVLLGEGGQSISERMGTIPAK